MIQSTTATGEHVLLNPLTITWIKESAESCEVAFTGGTQITTKDDLHELHNAWFDQLTGLLTILADPMGAGLSAIDAGLAEIREAINRNADRQSVHQPPLIGESP